MEKVAKSSYKRPDNTRDVAEMAIVELERINADLKSAFGKNVDDLLTEWGGDRVSNAMTLE
jgi:hypothetical protein